MTEIAFPNPELSDGVVTLRPLRASDAPVIAQWMVDGPIRMFTAIGLTAGTTAAEVLAELRRCEADRQQGRGIRLGIARTDGDVLLGSCHVQFEGEDGLIAEIGCLLSPAARGEHLAERVGALGIGWLFNERNVRRVQAHVNLDNEPSHRLLRSVGLRPEGVVRGYCPDGADAALYGLLPDDLH